MKIKQRIKNLLLLIIMPVLKTYWKIFQPKTFGVKVLIVHPQDSQKILLVLHAYGSQSLWNIPGGGYRPTKETSEDAVRREAFEELGVKFSSLRNVEIYKTEAEGKCDSVTLFLATLEPGSVPSPKEELRQIIWEDYASTLLRDDVARITKQAIRASFKSS